MRYIRLTSRSASRRSLVGLNWCALDIEGEAIGDAGEARRANDEFLGVALVEIEPFRAALDGAQHRQVAKRGGRTGRLRRPARCRGALRAGAEAGELKHLVGVDAAASEEVADGAREVERQIAPTEAVLIVLIARQRPAEMVGNRPHRQSGLLAQGLEAAGSV